MRIKLYTFLDEANEAYLNMPIILKSPRSGFLRVKAIIDTGSPKTVLGHPEAMALQIPITSITSQNIIRLGGNKYWSGVFDRLKIMMKSEDGKLISGEIAVNVLKPTTDKETHLDLVYLLAWIS